jgi:uncharacterized low-complexity protein
VVKVVSGEGELGGERVGCKVESVGEGRVGEGKVGWERRRGR